MKIERLKQAFKEAESSLVRFRELFLSEETDYPSAWFHYKISDILLYGDRNYAVQSFRESGKSQYVLRAFLLHSLVFPNRDRRFIVIIKKNQDLANNKLFEIEEEYLGNPLFSANLVRVIKKTTSIFDVVVKGSDGSDIEVRIMAFGKGSSIRGLSYRSLRPQIIVIDDPQDLEDSLSDSALEKDWEWFLSDIKFLSNKSRIFMIGNNLGRKCIVELIFEHSKELGFEVMRIPALDKDNNPTWGENPKFSREALLIEKENYRRLGKLDIWIRERLCEAVDEETALFKRSYFHYFNFNDLDLGKLNIYMAVDLASRKNEDSHYTAIVVVGVNDKNNWFILDIDYGKYSPAETLERIFKLVQVYNPISVGIEVQAYQIALKNFLEVEMIRRNQFFTIEEIKSLRSKEVRIKGLEPRYRLGLVWHREGANYLGELEDELLMFPKSRYDDLIDALAMINELAGVPVRRAKVNIMEMQDRLFEKNAYERLIYGGY